MSTDPQRDLVEQRARRGLFTAAPAPVRVGRYLLEDAIGEGAMGVVHAAYDDVLDRKLAVKFVRPHAAGSSEGRARMLREAKAMARLSHPNVVQVYDAGTYGDQLFIAMEFVDGRTLTRWLQQERDRLRWSAILDCLVSAGRGIAAAHDAGVIHRDFKPDNVLVTATGTPKVADFGLAGIGPAGSAEVLDTTDASQVTITSTGVVVGTPLYMPPEVHAGRPADARSDQFAFCVAAYEALFHQRPFAGTTRTELAAAVAKGELQPRPARPRLPGAIATALRRGLSADPQARYPSMHELLADLAEVPRRRRRTFAVGAVFVVLGLGLGGHQVQLQRKRAACRTHAQAIEATWNGELRAAAATSFLATGLPFASRSFEHTASRLDDYAAKWTDAREQVCVRATIDATWPDGTHDAAIECLEDRARALGSLVPRLREANEEVARRAVAAAADLPSIDACTDLGALAHRPARPTDPGQAADVERLRAIVAKADGQRTLGDPEGALATVESVRAEVEALGYGPLQAELDFVAGHCTRVTGDLDTARTRMESAFFEAGRCAYPELEADAAIGMISVARVKELHEEALTWGRHADNAIARLGRPDPVRRAMTLGMLGRVHLAAGDYDTAADEQRRGLALAVEALGEQHPTLELFEWNLATVHSAQGRHEEAIAAYERVLEIRIAAFGPDHPTVGKLLLNIAMARTELGRPDEAIRDMERALAVLRAGLGDDSEEVARALGNLGSAHRQLGHLTEALDYNEQSLAALERVVGPDTLAAAMGATNLANVRFQAGQHARAIEEYRGALRVAQKAAGPRHPAVGSILSALGTGQFYTGNFVAAERRYREALDLHRANLGEHHHRTGKATLDLGLAIDKQGRADEALGHFERALEILSKTEGNLSERHHAELALAKALWDRPQARARARELAAAARDGYAALGPAGDGGRDDAEAWLQAHPVPAAPDG